IVVGRRVQVVRGLKVIRRIRRRPVGGRVLLRRRALRRRLPLRRRPQIGNSLSRGGGESPAAAGGAAGAPLSSRGSVRRRGFACAASRGWCMIELLSDPAAWASLLTLTVMEIVLGIDNIVFI